MAIEYDISSLMNKTENEGSTEAGRLTAKEWNHLVGAVGEVQGKLENASNIKGILYKGGPDKGGQLFNAINDDGYLLMNPVDPTGDVAIFVTSSPASYISSDADCKVTFYVSSKIPRGDTNVSANVACNVNFYIDNGSGKDVLVGTDSIYDFEYDVPGVKKEITFDFAAQTTALGRGNIDNKLTIEVNNGYGKIIKEFIIVRVVELSLTVDGFDIKKVYTYKDKPQLKTTVYGSSANIYAEVDGTRILDGVAADVNVPKTFPTDIFDNAGVNKHGTHNIKIWAEVKKDIGNDEKIPISTNIIEYNYIYGTTDTDPIVMTNIANKQPEQYTVFNVAYVAYKYNDTNASVSGVVTTSIYEYTGTDEKGNLTLGRQLTSTNQSLEFDPISNSASGAASLSLFPVTLTGADGTTEEVALLGEMAIVISIENYKYVDLINIKPSSIILSEVPGYAVRLSSSGRSNTEDSNTLKVWSSNGIDDNGKAIVTNMIFDENIEFTNTGSGWIYDGDKYDENDPNDKGNVALRLRKGRYCTLDYKPFSKNRTFEAAGNNGTGTGMTISIEFATRNSLNQQASVISCLANDSLGNPRGFEVLANKASIYSKNNMLYADFKEDTRIKLDFVIDGKQWPYPYDTVWTEDGGKGETVSKTDTENEALCIIYVDGVYQALAIIPEGDSFMQSGGGETIRFGSDECDLDIYNIRIYNQALTPLQIVQNYSYDTPNVKNKLAIAARNQDVLTIDPARPQKPNINIEGLRRARPELPFFYVEMDTEADPDEILPKDKKKWKLMKKTQYKNPTNDNSQAKGNASFEIPYAVMRNQGTSSMTYPWPWRNWDWKTKDGDYPQGKGEYYLPTIDDPTAVITKYWAQYQGMNNIDTASGKGNIRKITLKKDYASSEMCNNAITSEMFTDMANGIGDAIPGVLSLAQRNNGGKNSPFRLTFVAQPCFMIRKYSDPTKEGTAGKGYEALGMMNLIPNKNECAYLGFYGNYEWDPEVGKRAQSWELADNYPEYFWKQEIKGVQRIDNDGKYTNDIKGFYEARYPKDTTVFYNTITNDEGEQEREYDGDFGMVKPSTITPEQENAVADEQRDLIEFHNWLVSTNRQIPVEYKNANGNYRDLDADERAYDWNMKDNEPIHTQDTPAYRLDKFRAEADKHIIIDQFALYYIWREMFWAYDSGFKNLQIYTMGTNPNMQDSDVMQWGCMVRDADTTLGIQNQGRIEFLPYLEDTDYYTETNGVKTWHFDALVDKYDESEITKLNGKHVLNGQLGSLWINIRDAFYDRIEDIYTKLSENSNFTHWTSGKAIKRFRDHQEKWCESLYNFGMRQYFGGSPFTKWINSGLGDKKNSRASWLQQAFYYRDSKYRVLSDYAAFRAGCYNTPDFEEGHTQNQILKFKLYQPVYLSLGANKIDPKECLTHRRITDVTDYIDVTPTELRLPIGANSAMGVQYGTNNMIEIGDFARVCKIYEVQSWQFPKLKKLLLGKDPDRDGDGVTYYEYDANGNTVPFSNDSMNSIDLSSLKQLQVLDLTNHSKLGNFNASYCTELKELYATGCNSTKTITLPNTTTLNTIYLPYSITEIDFVGLSGINKFKLATPPMGESYAISRLNIQNCGNYMAAESYNVVTQVLSTLEKVYHPEERNNICILTGINWQNATVEVLERLLNINAQLSGKINLTNALRNDLKVRLVNKYGDIDNPNNGLYIEYTQTALTEISLPNKMYIYQPGIHELTFNYKPTGANTYSRAEWILSSNEYATINSETGVITRNEVEANESSPAATLKLKVYQIPDRNGIPRPVLESNNVSVYFYERHAQPGDIVYHDGSFSDEIDATKTAIGVCFYVDPNNKLRRLMVALENISENTTSAEPTKYSWGIGDGQAYSGGTYQGSPVLSNLDNYGITSMSELRDIKHISNITEHGGDVNNPQMLNDAVYRNSNDPDNDYFFKFPFGTRMGHLGWDVAKYDIEIFNKDIGAYEKLIESGKEYPIGYISTIGMIEKREWSLSYFNKLNITGSTTNYSELYNLYNDLREAENAQIEGWTRNSNTYLFPAASLAYAYEPGGEGVIKNLNSKFKKRNWFLPASGDAVRIAYYMRQYFEKDSEFEKANAFKLAIDNKKLTTRGYLDSSTNGASGMTILTCTETVSSGSSVGSKYIGVIATGKSASTTINGITTYSGICATVEKYTQNSIRPICAF